MGLRFNPPAEWPAAPEGFVPPAGWQPDPSWPSAPPGWQLWVDDDLATTERHLSAEGQPAAAGQPAGPPFAPVANAPQAAMPYYSPGAAYGPGSPYAGYAAPGQAQGTSGWAIAALVCGVVSVSVLGLIFGFVALSKIRKSGQRGKGLAIGGICASGFWILVLAVGIAVGVINPSTPAGPSVPPGAASVSVFTLRTGECFDNPTGASSVTYVSVMPCSLPHNAQIFATFNLHGGSNFDFPGQGTVQQLATNGCNARINVGLDKPKLTNRMSIRFIFPTLTSWLTGHRTVACMIVNPASDLRSSLTRSG
jgi:Domain of unknown function (DUF4190)/Septum formation